MKIICIWSVFSWQCRSSELKAWFCLNWKLKIYLIVVKTLEHKKRVPLWGLNTRRPFYYYWQYPIIFPVFLSKEDMNDEEKCQIQGIIIITNNTTLGSNTLYKLSSPLVTASTTILGLTDYPPSLGIQVTITLSTDNDKCFLKKRKIQLNTEPIWLVTPSVKNEYFKHFAFKARLKSLIICGFGF